MSNYKVTRRAVEPEKPKRSLGRMVAKLVPGLIGLILIGLGLLEIVMVNQAGQRAGGRAGIALIVIGLVVLGAWSLGNKTDGYNF